ncbi:putative iq and hect domain protein [Phaeoacremonium minimum UCRPA7]|uniref:HECT-type E3 ubiquitin transferase n=1 Tax=Phaeoacremonium minimum (strain UCR-PA7) TaxID=1286976 RepID=R8BWN6_PHAM7|nr:putative iq and hect domain protein [Phaeoacremonium minimum UCRPA7]EOO03745.1 putative iq and hect domain protein [Phaeoacremonium minimum UCRPA7]
MFPTFSGSSRRPRNVNLSGQKNTNPFAATSWTPSASSNASKTVIADAQAERRKRELERERLKAAQNIQRTWRGHQTRQSLKDSRRAAFDQLYQDGSTQDRFQRSLQALPLALAIFDPSRPDDCRRFGAFAEDLVQTDFQLLQPGQLDDAQLRRLGNQLVVALQRIGSDDLPQSFLTTLLEIITTRVDAVSKEATLKSADAEDQLPPFVAEAIRSLVDKDEISDLLEKFTTRRDSRTAAVAKDEALWDREWRTILLFLELYVFVLRLTDDEDFFAEILRNMPFVIPFDTRVKIFRQFVYLDKDRRRGGNIDPDNWRMAILNEHGGPFNPTARGRDAIGRHHAKIRRGKVFQDAFEQFYDLREGLKEPIQITFVDQFDTPEAGIDGGGVTKEFLTSVTKEAFTDELSLFVANSRNALYPNPAALDQRQDKLRQAGLTQESPEWRESITELLDQYEFLGRIIGKCMYEGILIDVVFAGFFLLKWSAAASDSGYRANINDLKELDEELYQGMLSLKNYPGDISDMGADFTIEDQISMPGEPVRTVTRNLIPNGDQVSVTNENRPLYISYMAHHRLVAQPFAVTRAFLKGLGSIITPSWLSMFNQSELQRLVGGDSSEIDVEDLRRNTVYSGLYVIGDDGEEHPTVSMFWDVMHSLKDEERREVLKYVTSTPRAPLLGFGQLSPRFSIRDGGDDQDRLPSASTCVNLLKLPKYKSLSQLKSKLLYAVKSNAGFDLS